MGLLLDAREWFYSGLTKQRRHMLAIKSLKNSRKPGARECARHVQKLAEQCVKEIRKIERRMSKEEYRALLPSVEDLAWWDHESCAISVKEIEFWSKKRKQVANAELAAMVGEDEDVRMSNDSEEEPEKPSHAGSPNSEQTSPPQGGDNNGSGGEQDERESTWPPPGLEGIDPQTVAEGVKTWQGDFRQLINMLFSDSHRKNKKWWNETRPALLEKLATFDRRWLAVQDTWDARRAAASEGPPFGFVRPPPWVDALDLVPKVQRFFEIKHTLTKRKENEMWVEVDKAAMPWYRKQLEMVELPEGVQAVTGDGSRKQEVELDADWAEALAVAEAEEAKEAQAVADAADAREAAERRVRGARKRTGSTDVGVDWAKALAVVEVEEAKEAQAVADAADDKAAAERERKRRRKA